VAANKPVGLSSCAQGPIDLHDRKVSTSRGGRHLTARGRSRPGRPAAEERRGHRQVNDALPSSCRTRRSGIAKASDQLNAMAVATTPVLRQRMPLEGELPGRRPGGLGRAGRQRSAALGAHAAKQRQRANEELASFGQHRGTIASATQRRERSFLWILASSIGHREDGKPHSIRSSRAPHTVDDVLTPRTSSTVTGKACRDG
jgi:hypothetical protein